MPLKNETFEVKIYEKRDGGYYVYLEWWGLYNKYSNGRLLKQEKREVEEWTDVLGTIGLARNGLILVDGKPKHI